MILKILVLIIGLGFSEIITTQYSVSGMVCKKSCPSSLRNHVEKIKGVKKCNVNFDEQFLSVTYNNTKLNEVDLVAQITQSYNSESDKKISINTKKNTCSKACCSAKTSSSWSDWFFGN